jgi:hypothetical protein
VSNISITGVVLGALVVAGIPLASCGRSPPEEEPWAQEAVELFDSIAADLTDVDRYAAASHFGDRSLLDLGAWGGELASGPLEIAEALGQTLYITPRAANISGLDYPDIDVDVDQLFVGAHEAVVRFEGHVGAAGVPWMQLYAISRSAVANARLYTEDLGHLDPSMRWTDAPEHPFYEHYIDVWSSGDERRLSEVYAGSVVVRDALDGRRWVGLDELAREMPTSSEIERGPWPELFRYDVGDRHEQIAVFQFGGSCPRLEARRWVLDGGLIVDETRFAHVGSVRRCGGPMGGGWWDGYGVDPPEQLAVQTMTIGGRQIDVVNANARQADFVRWIFGRFASGSLAQPDIAVVWFPPSVDCSLAEGIAQEEDDRFEGRHTVTLCLTPDEMSSGWPSWRWSTHVGNQALHEFAHVWMYDFLDEADRSAFLAHVGLDTWHGVDVFRTERGVEVAAETLAWGLADEGQAEYLIEPVPDCDELATRFELLTGTAPLTTCDPAGGG